MLPAMNEAKAKRAQSELIYSLRSILERVDLAELFPRQAPLEVELGSGDGSFLVEYARLHPDLNFVGIERLLGRVQKMARKAQRAALTNLRGIRIESSYFVQYLLPRHSVEALHIYFPDPWPKRKHRRHRLVNGSFPEIAAEALSPAGTVYLRTDDPDYFTQMEEVFGNARGFERCDTPAELAAVTTDFERDFNRQGNSTLRAGFRRKS